MCSAKLRDGVRYCWKCQSDQTQVGPPSDSCQQEPKTDKSERAQTSLGRPQNVLQGKGLTFEQFLKRKTSKENITHVHPTKKSKSNPNEELFHYFTSIQPGLNSIVNTPKSTSLVEYGIKTHF